MKKNSNQNASHLLFIYPKNNTVERVLVQKSSLNYIKH
jgi:hypothetical protein